ncbi:unnamed protein product [Paramecium sonneborni]|uniref:Transmembrane protein n=1 Tax=Paramecium sonneborni TaxID=65129 RepID=A0A8S1QBA1_9CILI|nr:unnamed protein product [Paramecium sonneborni]
MTFFIWLLMLFSNTYSLKIKEMDSLYQYSQQSIVIQQDAPSILSAFRYGLWSKYNPLTNILQVGSVGLFESDCFLLHRAVEEVTQALNLIYYDCLDEASQKIKKTIAFIDNEDVQHIFTFDVDPFEYENVWYYFQISQWPLSQRFELIFIYQEKTIHEYLNIKYPFKDQNLLLIFGGGLIVTQSKIETIETGIKFSYFPGKMIKVEYEFIEIPQEQDQEWFARMEFEPYQQCICSRNDVFKVEDFTLKWMEKNVYTSQNINCNSFNLQGWLKITDIIKKSDEFIYHLLILSSNFQNQFSDKNLSPFSLSYKISPFGNELILTTYSYTFPKVTINFSNDEQLIKKEFDITHSIYLWQKIQIKLIEDQLKINIQFYDNQDIHEYDSELHVKQFKCTQLKLEYGNIFQQTENYLNIQTKTTQFNNCDTNDILQSCHYSCQECDGPTQNNCLSCITESQRIYLPGFKACVCPFDTIDKENCVSYINSGLQLSSIKKVLPKCNYGYFEYEDLCIHCPSKINDKLATCQECLQNPKGWSKNPYCEYDLFLNQNGNVQSMEWYGYSIYYLFDGNVFIQCDHCNSSYSFIVDDSYIPNEIITLKKQKIICLMYISNCYECQKTIYGEECIQCYYPYQLINGSCISIENNFKQKYCEAPYYLTSERKCSLCPIINCKYCFEYQEDDLSKCTLYNNFIDFDSDIEAKIGCALCEDNFIFDFNDGTCQFKQSKQQNCLRSFIYKGQEMCTLSQIDDFNIAPEIINCQKYQPNCLQCIRSPEFTIKCVQCEIGFITSIQTGGCFKADQDSLNGASIIIEGVYELRDGWIQRIQSFLMKFLPNNYFYFQTKLDQMMTQQIVECQDGYHFVSSYKCNKYCDPQCQECILNYSGSYSCNKCPLNKYYQPIRDQIDGTCSECSQLCHACQLRTNQEIYKLQSTFMLSNSNSIHTKKCLKPVQHPQIYLDPYDQIAKYCFDQTCSNQFIHQRKIFYCEWFDIFWEFDLNIDYLNQIGIDSLVIHFIYSIQSKQCKISNFIIESKLKTKVFSLKHVHFILGSNKILIMVMTKEVYVKNIDKFEINSIIYENKQSYKFILQNNSTNVELKLTNVTFIDSEMKNIQAMFQNNAFGDVTFQDFSLVNTNFENSSILNLFGQDLNGIIVLERIIIQKCVFINSNLFQSTNNKVLLDAKEILIEDSQFTNSSLFLIDSNFQQLSIFDFFNVTIIRTNFTNSSFLQSKNHVAFSLKHLLFSSNILLFSELFVFQYNFSFSYIQILDCQFQESKFIQMIEKNEDQSISVLFKYLKTQKTQFINSRFLSLQSNQEFSQVEFMISNSAFKEITGVNNTDIKQFLFKIRCSIMYMQDITFIDLKNLLIFHIFESNEIIVENLIYENSAQVYQVPFSQNCQVKTNEKNQLLKIESFYSLIINSVNIINQFTSDESFIDLSQRREFNSTRLEIIDLTFRGNILLFKESTKSFSLLALNSEWDIDVKIRKIQFIENCFHSIANNFFQSYSSLLYLNIKTSKIQMLNFVSERNAFTNSSNTFIYINSKTLFIQDLKILNHNVLSYQQWERFYGLKLDKFYDQQQINQIAFKIFNISNIGGVAQITTSIFNCLNCNFNNILAFKSAIFEITALDLGIVIFRSFIVNDILQDLRQVSNSSGCVSLYSSDGLINLEIQNSIFKNVYNRMSSSILSIQPSKIKNKINLTEIQIFDCLSLMNQILFVEFSDELVYKNTLNLENIIVQQNKESWIQLFQQIGNLSLTELLRISSSQNSLFYIKSSSIRIRNVRFEGLYISPILKIINAPNIDFQKFEARFVQQIYSFTLISIIQMIDIETISMIQQLNIQNSSIQQVGSQRIFLQNNDYILEGCVIINKQQKQISDPYYLNYIINALEQHSSTQLSLIHIQSQSNKHSFYFNKLEIIENNCLHCTDGLFYLNLISFQKITILQLNCYYNNIQYYGCLKILDENKISSKIQILSSSFIRNKGNQGVAISSNRPINIISCKFIQNIASFRAGSLYLELNNDQFIIKNSIIIGNQAQEGGGIYLKGDNNLNSQNFIQTYLKFNEAYNFANNLVESPTNLVLLINQFEMKSLKLNSDKVQTNILKIQPYQTIDQENRMESDYLMIPSGQAIQSFSISIPKLQQTYKQIQQMTIQFKNSLNELQKDLINSTCKINDHIIQLNDTIINGSLQNIELLYNIAQSTFDLSPISFKFDPYNSDYKYLEISIYCSIQNYQNPLNYIIQAKSYKCQLGQFYIDEGCQICESTQGFYSVTYDSNKCSIFDKEKFEEITSNQIKLKEGYWRPHYLSDESSLCFKITSFCVGGWDQGDSLCSKGHVGALCEECDIYDIRGEGKYLKNLQNSSCLPCFGIEDSIMPFILNSIWAIVSIVLTLKSIEKSNDLFLFLKIKERFSQILFKLNQDLVSILIKMFLNYLWIFSVIFTFNINFSFQFNFVDQASNTSYSMANNLDCYLSDAIEIQVIYSKIILILMLILWQFIIIIFGLVVFSILVRSKFKSNIISNTLLCLYIFNYAGFIKMLCSVVSYREIANIKYIQGDLTLEFDSETHHLWMFYLVIPGLLIFGCLIPLSLFFLMYFKRQELNLHTLRPHICYLFNEYEKKSYYWEQIKLIKRAIMILILTYFETNIHLKASLIGLCMICYQKLAVRQQPYIISKFNKLDLHTGQICSITIFLSAIKYESEKLNNQVISLALQIILMLLFLLISFPFIYNILQIYYNKYRLLALKYIHLTFKHLKLRYASKMFEQFIDEQQKKHQKLKENLTKLRKYLIVVSKAQIKNRPSLFNSMNNIQNYQQKLLSTEIPGQSVLLTAKRFE